MRLFDPVSGRKVWDSADPNAGPVPPPRVGSEWRVEGNYSAAPQPAKGIEHYLGGTGIPEKLAMANQMFNPVEAIGQSMQAGQRLVSPGRTGWQRVQDTGDMLSGIAGVVGPAVAASKAGAPAASALQEAFLGFSMSPQALTARNFMADEDGGLKLYHGSPHDFDEFSLSKIGTGEGAQAYGHGLYFAEAEDTARAYRDDLSRPKNMWTQQAANGGLEVQYKTRDGRIGTAGVFDPAKGDVFDQAMSAPFGRMYEVEVNANPDDFLDWDRPLSEQPEIARKLGLRIRSEREINDEAYGLFDKYGTFDAMPADARSRLEYLNDEVNLPGTTQTGREIYEYGVGQQENVHDLLSGPDPYRADKLRELGIPGIRYLDAGSRGAGDGSRNYVVFDDKLISIVRKYGVAGAASMLGVSTLDVEQAMAEGRK